MGFGERKMMPEKNKAIEWDKYPEFSETLYYMMCVLMDYDMDNDPPE